MTCRICGEDSPNDLLLRQKCGCWKLSEDELRDGVLRLRDWSFSQRAVRDPERDPEPPTKAA